jgi:hypothetical protein
MIKQIDELQKIIKMKKSFLNLLAAILISASIYTNSNAQQPNTGSGNDGGKCKILSGPNKGKSGTYDGGFCCTGKEGSGDCTECVGSDGKANGKCADAITKPITPAFAISGNWVLSTDMKGGKHSVLTVSGNTLSVDMSSFNRPVAKGVLIDKKTVRLTFPDKKSSVFGELIPPNKIAWSDGITWIKKYSK